MKCDELTPIDLEWNMGKDINGVEHREPWKAYDIDEVNEAIAELKAQLESEKASRYAESVDAGMRERRLKRALWLSRSERAKEAFLKWNLFANFESEDKLFTIDEYDETPGATDGQVLRTYTEWLRIWQNVERKCREKSKEYL